MLLPLLVSLGNKTRQGIKPLPRRAHSSKIVAFLAEMAQFDASSLLAEWKKCSSPDTNSTDILEIQDKALAIKRKMQQDSSGLSIEDAVNEDEINTVTNVYRETLDLSF